MSFQTMQRQLHQRSLDRSAQFAIKCLTRGLLTKFTYYPNGDIRGIYVAEESDEPQFRLIGCYFETAEAWLSAFDLRKVVLS